LGEGEILEENSQKVENFFYFSSKNILFFLKMFYFPLFFSARVGKTDLVVVLPLKHNNPIVGGVGNDDPTLVVHGDTFARSEDS